MVRPAPTSMVTNFVAPSASRTIACASWREMSVSATSRRNRSRRAEAAGPWPVASSTKASLVDVSPSTVTQLKVRAATRCTRRRSAACGTRASVATKPSIVAKSGRIIPAPLAMPLTVALPPERRTRRENALGTVSVVMIASAAESQSS